MEVSESVATIDQMVGVGARADRVFAVACDHQSFPSITVGKLIRRYVPLPEGRSRWLINVSGCPIGWTQRTFINERAREIQFSLVEGDFEMWEGAFQVSETREGAKLSLAFRCQVGIPVIEGLLKPTLEAKMGEFARQLLEAIKRRAETVAAE